MCSLKELPTSQRHLFIIIKMFVHHFSKNNPFRSSSQEVFQKSCVLEKTRKIHKKYLCWSLFLKSCRSQVKRRRRWRCFPVNFATFLRTNILQNTYERLFLTFRVLYPEVSLGTLLSRKKLIILHIQHIFLKKA